jgi:hydrogenase maturation protease
MFLVIGYGNTMREDDGVGQHIARRLGVSLYRDAVEVISCHQLTPELVEPVSRADYAVFVDASEDGLPGEVRCYPVEPMMTTAAFTHQVTPAALLAAAYDLYGTHPKGIVISIPGAHFGYGETLSPEVERLLPGILQGLHQMMDGALTGQPNLTDLFSAARNGV